MPPLKEYIFQHCTDKNITIHIMAYDIEEAGIKLALAANNELHYTLINQ